MALLEQALIPINRVSREEPLRFGLITATSQNLNQLVLMIIITIRVDITTADTQDRIMLQLHLIQQAIQMPLKRFRQMTISPSDLILNTSYPI